MENFFGFSFCAIFFLHYLLNVLAGIVSWYAKSTIERSILVSVNLVALGPGDDGFLAYACAGAALLYLGYIMFDEDFLMESPHIKLMPLAVLACARAILFWPDFSSGNLELNFNRAYELGILVLLFLSMAAVPRFRPHL